MRPTRPKQATLLFTLIALTTAGAGLFVAGASDPANAARDADLVVHGTVIGVEQCPSGAPSFQSTDVFHPVHIQVQDVFAGNVSGETVTINAAGSELAGVWVSTAASFSRGEEVVVMLQEHEDHLYMTTGSASKYHVNSTGLIRLSEHAVNATGDTVPRDPEDRTINLTEMARIVHDATNATGPAPNQIEHGPVDPSTVTAPTTCSLWDRIRAFLGQLF